MSRLVYILPMLFFAVLAFGFFVALRTGEQALPSTLIGKEPRPFDLAVLNDAGAVDADTRLASADLRSDGVTVVNFWASWCGPCKIEHPQLMALRNQPGVTLYGIDYKDDPADAQAFLSEHGNPFARVGFDGTGRAGVDWGITGVPETFILDRAGRVRYKHTGPIMPGDMERFVLPAIRAAATAPPGD